MTAATRRDVARGDSLSGAASLCTVLHGWLLVAACGATAAPLYRSQRPSATAMIVLDDGVCVRAALHGSTYNASSDNCAPTELELPSGSHELLVDYTPPGSRMENLPLFFVRFEATAGRHYRLSPVEWEQRLVHPRAVDPGMFVPVARNLPRRFVVTEDGESVPVTSREASDDDRARLRLPTVRHVEL